MNGSCVLYCYTHPQHLPWPSPAAHEHCQCRLLVQACLRSYQMNFVLYFLTVDREAPEQITCDDFSGKLVLVVFVGGDISVCFLNFSQISQSPSILIYLLSLQHDWGCTPACSGSPTPARLISHQVFDSTLGAVSPKLDWIWSQSLFWSHQSHLVSFHRNPMNIGLSLPLNRLILASIFLSPIGIGHIGCHSIDHINLKLFLGLYGTHPGIDSLVSIWSQILSFDVQATLSECSVTLAMWYNQGWL